MGQSICDIQVWCDNCNGPHLTKDCNLYENGNRKAQFSNLMVIDLMKIGGSPKGNGYHMKNKRRKKKKSIDKPDENFTKKYNHHQRRNHIPSECSIDSWKLLKKNTMLFMLPLETNKLPLKNHQDATQAID